MYASRLVYSEILHAASNDGVTLKSGLGVVQIENGTQFESLGTVSYSHSICLYLVSFPR